jgi:hypothetical protein
MKATVRILASLSMVTALGCGGAASSAMGPSATEDGSVATADESSRAGAPLRTASHDPAELQALMDRVFVHIQDVTQVALSAGDDCELMADKLQSWGDEHDADLSALAVEVREIDRQTQREAVEIKLESDPEFGMNFMIAVSTCQEHDGATAAWKALLDKLTK